jgi:hypothetical protein
MIKLYYWPTPNVPALQEPFHGDRQGRAPPWGIPTFSILQQANVTMLATVTLDCPDGRLKTVNRCYP